MGNTIPKSPPPVAKAAPVIKKPQVAAVRGNLSTTSKTGISAQAAPLRTNAAANATKVAANQAKPPAPPLAEKLKAPEKPVTEYQKRMDQLIKDTRINSGRDNNGMLKSEMDLMQGIMKIRAEFPKDAPPFRVRGQ